MRKVQDINKSDDGQVMILFALFFIVLVGALGLALDAGYLMTERRHAQAAADAGALAGAVRLMSGDGDVAATTDALGFVQANDIDLSAGTGATASVSIVGDKTNGTVTVDVMVPVTKFFIGALYTGEWKVTAHAVAEVNDNADGRYAIVALEEPGMAIIGAPAVDVIGGGAFSNSDIARSGQANAFTVDTTLDAVGTVDEGSLWEAQEGFHDTRPVMDDPLASLQPPPKPAIDEAINPADHPDMAPCMPGYVGPLRDCVLVPGYYKDLGEITIKGTATLLPGLYYFEGTSIYLNGDAARITDDDQGAMLYFAQGSSPTTTYFDPANSSGGVHLTHPASSPYEGGLVGMTLWIDNCSDFESRGAGEFYIKGVFYAPCSYVWLHGNPYGETISGQVIVGTLDIRGTTDFVAEYVDYVHTPRLGVFLIE